MKKGKDFIFSFNNYFSVALENVAQVMTILICLSFGNLTAQNNSSLYDRIWGTYYGPYITKSVSSAIDSDGNIYMLSEVWALNMETEAANYITPGAYQTTYGGGESDILLSKFDSEGSLVWSTFFGGEGGDWSTDITWYNGNLYIVGSTSSSTGMTTTGSFQESMVDMEPITIPRYTSGFLTKFSSSGNLIWSTYVDGERMEAISSVTVKNGQVFITGNTNSTSHLTTVGSFQENLIFTDVDNQRAGLIMKFNENGERVWGTYYGTGAVNDMVSDLSVDSSGNLFVVGTTEDATGYFSTTDAYQMQNNGNRDIFVSKFTSSGSRLWSTYYGGDENDKGQNIIVLQNNIYVSGASESATNIASSGSYQENLIGTHSNMIFLKMDSETYDRIWCTYYGANGMIPFNLSYSNSSEAYEFWLTGTTNSYEHISTDGAYQEQPNPNTGGANHDGYFAKFSEDGNLSYASYYGGEKRDAITKVLPMNDEDGFYLTGTTMSYNAIATSNAYQSELPNGNNPTNSFLIKFMQKRMGVEDSQYQKLSLWPNPTDGQFTVEGKNFGELQISIFDLIGREVYTQYKVKIGQPIELQDQLSSGIYIVKLKSQNQRLTTIKLLVK